MLFVFIVNLHKQINQLVYVVLHRDLFIWTHGPFQNNLSSILRKYELRYLRSSINKTLFTESFI